MKEILQSRKHIYSWHALYTKSRTEKKAYHELFMKGIETYLPLKTVRKQYGKQIRITEEPLIRGYVFVKVSNKEYYEALFVPGILWYVSFSGKPAVITDQQMDSLKIFMKNAQNDVQVTSENIRKGNLVMVTDGPLKNVCAEVVEIRGRNRILLRLDKLGCCVHVELETSNTGFITQNKSAFQKEHAIVVDRWPCTNRAQ